MTQNSKEPAFPSLHVPHKFGLTKREHIATAILAGLVAGISDPVCAQIAEGVKGGKYYVGAAVALTDALLAKLEEPR